VPVFIMIGFVFAANIEHVFHRIERVKHIVLPIVAVVLVGAGIWWLLKRRRAAPAVDQV
jgi:membrane protein DedA with SNARE-associated domain